MGNKVQSKNIIGYMKVGLTYYPVFCGKTLSFTIEQDTIETTSVNTGVMREYMAGMGDATFDCTGVTILDNTENRIAITYIQQQSVRLVTQDWKIVLTDDDGTTKTYIFSGLIKTSAFSKTLPGYSESSLSVKISGNITIDDTPPPDDEFATVYSDWWTMGTGLSYIGSNSDVHAYNLAGVTILEVDREGVQYNKITTGTPVNSQFKHNNTTGTITFSSLFPAEAGETVFVLFSRS